MRIISTNESRIYSDHGANRMFWVSQNFHIRLTTCTCHFADSSLRVSSTLVATLCSLFSPFQPLVSWKEVCHSVRYLPSGQVYTHCGSSACLQSHQCCWIHLCVSLCLLYVVQCSEMSLSETGMQNKDGRIVSRLLDGIWEWGA